jgi:cell division protein FtsW
MFLGLSAGLLAVGLVMLLSASGPIGHHRFNDGWYFLKHQLLLGFLPGLLLFLVLRRIDYRLYRRYPYHFLGLALLLLICVFIPGLAGDWSQTRSWIRIFGVSFQPIEAVKLSLIIFLAAWFESMGRDRLRDLKTGVVPFVGLMAVVAALVALQPDFGSLAVIAGATAAAWFVAGAAWPHLFGLSAIGFAGLALAVRSSYRADRLNIFLHPELDPQGIGYHINQALLALGSGGWLGLGLGHSRQKYLYLPETFGDSIFAVIGEELGFVLTLVFLILLFGLFWRGLEIARRAPDTFGRVLAVGIIGWFFCQSVFNIGSMLGLLPITGLPLPFISYGGSALAVSMAALGVMTNISSHAGLEQAGRRR